MAWIIVLYKNYGNRVNRGIILLALGSWNWWYLLSILQVTTFWLENNDKMGDFYDDMEIFLKL